MTYTCPAWEFTADTYPYKLQRLQNRVIRTIGNFPRRTPVRELHVAFKILQVQVSKLSEIIYVTTLQN
jgi:hypothetical protein